MKVTVFPDAMKSTQQDTWYSMLFNTTPWKVLDIRCPNYYHNKFDFKVLNTKKDSEKTLKLGRTPMGVLPLRYFLSDTSYQVLHVTVSIQFY